MTSITLLNMRARQGINSQFISGKLGWVLVFFELTGAASIIYAIMEGYLYTRATSMVFIMAFVILLSSGYLSAEKYFSAPENRYDLLMGIPVHNIFWAIYGQVYWSSLRVMALFPLIMMASTGTIYPGLMALAFFVLPAAAALAACGSNILINRYWKRISGMFYMFFSILWVGGILAIFAFLFAKHNLSFAPLTNRDALLALLLLLAVAIAIIYFSKTLAGLWKEAFLQKDTVIAAKLPFQLFHRFSRFLASSFTVKEWVLLWRNPVTQLRLAVWAAALMIVCCIATLKSYLGDSTLFLIISLGVWLFCFGEMPATAWQNEGEHKYFYWLTGFSPPRLIAAKIIVYLPLSALGILTALFFGLAAHLSWGLILQKAGLVFLLVSASMIIALAAACLGFDGTRRTYDNVIFEQVPLTKSGMAAVALEFLFCCTVFLPVQWIFVISAALPAICLIGQSVWLNRICYSQ